MDDHDELRRWPKEMVGAMDRAKKYPDALKVWVRGFGDVQTGNRISAALAEKGFTLTEQISGESDSLGGIIETDILGGCPSWEEVRQAIYAAAGNVETFIQFQKYLLLEESDI